MPLLPLRGGIKREWYVCKILDVDINNVCFSYLDFINLMAYDFHGKWERETGHNAPLYAPSSDSEWRKQLSVDHAAHLWVKLGAPKDKLIIGKYTLSH
jgi:GH18 family chitinase